MSGFSPSRRGIDSIHIERRAGRCQHPARQSLTQQETLLMKAWTFQLAEQKRTLDDKAPWYVGYYDPEGKRRKRRIGCKSRAEKYARRIEGELAAGTYQTNSRKVWADFRAEYLDDASGKGKAETLFALRHFERIAKPVKVTAIKTKTIADYVKKRRTEPSKRRKGMLVSPATINKELRHLKAVLRKANDWGFLPVIPKFTMVKEPKHLPRYVSAEHFAAIYRACDSATRPRELPIEPADWWRALLVFCYMTGWRIGEPLALRRDDMDLDEATAITRAEDNKGGRDDVVPLHPVVVEHLRRIACFEPVVFPWYHHRRTLDVEFHNIQKAAGIHLACRADGMPGHEHTDPCHRYGFHDLRRAFATVNAETMTADALQALMRHKSYTTTQKYINMARQLNRAVDGLHVPEVLLNRSQA
jgi:integrase